MGGRPPSTRPPTRKGAVYQVRRSSIDSCPGSASGNRLSVKHVNDTLELTWILSVCEFKKELCERLEDYFKCEFSDYAIIMYTNFRFLNVEKMPFLGGINGFYFSFCGFFL